MAPSEAAAIATGSPGAGSSSAEGAGSVRLGAARCAAKGREGCVDEYAWRAARQCKDTTPPNKDGSARSNRVRIVDMLTTVAYAWGGNCVEPVPCKLNEAKVYGGSATAVCVAWAAVHLHMAWLLFSDSYSSATANTRATRRTAYIGDPRFDTQNTGNGRDIFGNRNTNGKMISNTKVYRTV